MPSFTGEQKKILHLLFILAFLNFLIVPLVYFSCKAVYFRIFGFSAFSSFSLAASERNSFHTVTCSLPRCKNNYLDSLIEASQEFKQVSSLPLKLDVFEPKGTFVKSCTSNFTENAMFFQLEDRIFQLVIPGYGKVQFSVGDQMTIQEKWLPEGSSVQIYQKKLLFGLKNFVDICFEMKF